MINILVQAILEAADSTFLLDEDDCVEKYEKENNENAKDITDDDVVDQLVKIGGRDAAASVLKGHFYFVFFLLHHFRVP